MERLAIDFMCLTAVNYLVFVASTYAVTKCCSLYRNAIYNHCIYNGSETIPSSYFTASDFKSAHVIRSLSASTITTSLHIGLVKGHS